MEQYFVPLFVVFCSFLLAIFFQKYLLPKLLNWAAKTKWDGDDILVRILGKSLFLWILLGGAYIAGLFPVFSGVEKVIYEKALLVFIVLSLGITFSIMVTEFVQLYARKKNRNRPTTSLFINLFKSLIFVLALLVVLESFGISIVPFLTALGIGGLAIALALQDTLSNFFSGFYMLVSHNIKPRDYIELENGEKGFVQDISWRNTTILTLPNNLVILPNSKIASSIIKNYSRPDQEMAVLVEVRVSYASDLKKVEQVVEEVGSDIMSSIPGAVEAFKPFIRFHTFADSGINFTVILRSRTFVDQYLVKHEFIKALHERFRAEDIEIPFPQMRLHLSEKK